MMKNNGDESKRTILKIPFRVWVWTSFCCLARSCHGEKLSSAFMPAASSRLSESVSESLPPDYFDKLEEKAYVNNVFHINNNKHVNDGSNWNLVEVTTEDKRRYRLGKISSLLPYSIEGKRRAKVEDDSFALLLAIHHFNTGHLLDSVLTSNSDSDSDTTLRESYSKCNLRLTTEVLDSQFSPIESIALLTDIHTRPVHPIAVLGPYRSACTHPSALVTGVNSVLHAGYHASSTDLDNREQYPHYVRTVPNARGDVTAAVDYFVDVLQVRHVGVLFVTDAYGSSAQVAFQEAARRRDLNIRSFSFSESSDNDDLDEVKEKKEEEKKEEDPYHGDHNIDEILKGGDRKEHPFIFEIQNALQNLKHLQYRYFFAIVGDEHYDDIMKIAHINGIAGDEYFWLFTVGVSRENFQRNARYPGDKPLAHVTEGIGIIQAEGRKMSSTILPPHPSLHSSTTTTTNTTQMEDDKFAKAWTEALSDQTLTSYFHSKQPSNLPTKYDNQLPTNTTPFSSTPSHHSRFIYDAVATMSLAMCLATTNTNQTDAIITGKSIYEQYLSSSQRFQFQGASGKLDTHPSTASRTSDSILYTIWNTRKRSVPNPTGEYADVMFDLVPTAHYHATNTTTAKACWHPIGGTHNTFQYKNSSTVQPFVLPPIQHNRNLIGTRGRIAGYTLMGIIMLTSILVTIWTMRFRATRVVSSATVEFLGMVAFGCFVMSLTIVPLSWDEMEELVEDCRLSSTSCACPHVVACVEGEGVGVGVLDGMCATSPLLYSIGFVICCSGLLTKVWRVYKVPHNIESNTITVTRTHFLQTFAILFVTNVFPVIILTLATPPKWKRIFKDSSDIFDRKTESFGLCQSSQVPFFFIVMVGLNIALLIVSNFFAYRATRTSTEHDEGRYVMFSMMSILQAWSMGLPILFLTEESPQAKFFVLTAIIFVTCGVVLLLVFVPKLIAVREELKRKEEHQARKKLYDNGMNGVHDGDDFDSFTTPKVVTWNRNTEYVPKFSSIGMKSVNES